MHGEEKVAVAGLKVVRAELHSDRVAVMGCGLVERRRVERDGEV